MTHGLLLSSNRLIGNFGIFECMILDFFNIALKLKKISRQGWIDKLNLNPVESVSDHTYMMTLMAMVLADHTKLDTLKIIKMSLLHDLAEAKIGDVIPGQMSVDKKCKLENSAMCQILNELPESIRNNYQKIWDEFQNGASEESVFVHEIDKLEMALQAKNYSKETSSDNIKVFFESARKSIQNKHLQNILDDILSQ